MWRITGDDLNAAFSAGYKQRIIPDCVGRSPTEALERITDCFGVVPSRSGDNVEGIVELRELIRVYPRHPSLFAGLMITAPHTHWETDNPLLISFVDGRYEVMEAEACADVLYRAVSFVLTSDGPLPYEWADGSVAMNGEELDALWDCVRWLAKQVHTKAWPLGISLNYRFKALLDPIIVNTSEYQIEANHKTPAVIMKSAEVDLQLDNSIMEQVAWHSACPSRSRLDEVQTALIDDIQAYLNNLPDAMRMHSLASLQAKTLK